MNVVTAEAEWALERLVARLAEYHQFERLGVARARPQGRHVARRARAYDANALVDLVAVAESFCVQRLTSIRSIGPEALATWAKRSAAWNREASVNLTAFPKWNALMGFVEVRNSQQHGLGRLTDRQLGNHKQEVLRWLDAAAIHRNGDILQISNHDVLRCGAVCYDFMGWLDSIAPTQ